MVRGNFGFSRREPLFLISRLEAVLKEEYGLAIKKVEPKPKGYKIETEAGNCFLQEDILGSEHTYFMSSATEHLIKNGFNNIPRFIPTLKGIPFFIAYDSTYYLTQWIEGQEINLGDFAAVQEAARVLALFHSASAGFVPHSKSKVRMDFRRWPEYFTRWTEELLYLGKSIEGKESKDALDLCFLDNFQYYYLQGRKAIRLLEKTGYLQVVAHGERSQSFCYHNCTFDDLTLTSQGVYITDLSNCRFEIRCFDLGCLVQRHGEESRWKIRDAEGILQEYGKVNPLDQSELMVLHAFLTFPKPFWNLISYACEKDLTKEERQACLQQLLLMINGRENREEFLEGFANLVDH